MSTLNRQVHVIDEGQDEEQGSEAKKLAEKQMRESMKHTEQERMEALDHTKIVRLCEDVPEKIVTTGKEMEDKEERRLLEFLRNNHDAFAWSSSDLKGVDRTVIEHDLNTDPKVKPKMQRQSVAELSKLNRLKCANHPLND
ncbi:hypothetical protein SEVIR_7G063902v4 [Setaria viridis]